MKRASLLHHPVTAWAILVCSLALTAAAWYLSDSFVHKRAHDRFLFHAEELQAALVKRMTEYESVLRGGVGLFAASQEVSRGEWRAYVSRLGLENTFPGIQGYGYSQIVPPGEKADHIRRVRAEGFPEYTIRPEGERELYSAIIFLEPFGGRNLRAFGFDMWSEPTRRAAMARAWESGEAAISGIVKLVQETETDVQRGFLMYLPVYRNGMPVATAAERKAALQGFVYSPFRIKDLMRGILGADMAAIDFELYDGAAMTPESLLFTSAGDATAHYGQDTAHHAFNLVNRLSLAGREWSLFLYAQPGYLTVGEESQPLIIALGGVLVDILLFYIILDISRQEKRTLAMAEGMTAELRQHRGHLQSILDNFPFLVWLKDREGRLLSVNRPFLAACGRESADQVVGLTDRELWPQEDAQRFVESDHEVIRERRQRSWDLKREEGGSERWYETFKAPLFDHDGQVTGVIGYARDVTVQKGLEQELRSREATMRAVLGAVANAIITIDEQGRILTFNAAAERIFGYRAGDVTGKNVKLLMPSPYHEEHDGYLERYLHTGVPRVIGIGRQVVGRKSNGVEFPVDLTVNELLLGEERRFVGVINDISERKQAEEKLLQAHGELTASVAILERRDREMTLLNRMNDLLLACQDHEEAFRVIRISAEELFPGLFGALSLYAADSGRMIPRVVWGAAAELPPEFALDDCWAIRRGRLHEAPDPGRSLHCAHFTVLPVAGYVCLPLMVQGNTLGLLTVENRERNPTQREVVNRLLITFGEAIKLALSNLNLREALREQATRDPLTRLYNRRSLDELLSRELERCLRQSLPLSVVVVDVDFFKRFNDTHGHDAGDHVLKELARVLRENLPRGDFPCRFGGEEFVVVMPETPLETAAARCELLRERFGGLELHHGGKSLGNATLSAGVAQAPRHGVIPAELLKVADTALYAAKQGGRNRVVTG